MKRLLLAVLLLLAVAAGALYALRDRIAGAVMRDGLERVEALARQRGMVASSLAFREARLSGLGTIAAESLSGEFQLQRGLLTDGAERLFFEARHAAVSVTSVWNGRVQVTVLGGMVVMLDPAGRPTGQQVADLSIDADLRVYWRELDDSARLIEEEVRRLLRTGSFAIPARVSGVARFQIAGKWHDVSIHSQAESGLVSLRLDRDGVRGIAKAYLLPLTEAEVDLVAENPVRAPALLRISQEAFSTSETLRRKDPKFPYDAYRHVYWSWLLTKQFGAEFSERVTDAHEIRPTYEVSEASRRMDLHNNSVGRAYALAGVPGTELVQRVLTDPNVMRKEG